MQRRKRKLSAKLRRLTPREYLTLRLLAMGFTVKQIATEYGVRVGTVRVYTFEARRKLDAETLYQAVAILARG